MVIAEIVELFVAPVFAIDDQRLMLRHVVGCAQILENSRYRSFEAGIEELLIAYLRTDTFEFFIFSGGDVQRAFAMASVDVLKLIDRHSGIKCAAFDEVVAKEARV